MDRTWSIRSALSNCRPTSALAVLDGQRLSAVAEAAELLGLHGQGVVDHDTSREP
jgi:hypothetical protein